MRVIETSLLCDHSGTVLAKTQFIKFYHKLSPNYYRLEIMSGFMVFHDYC